MTPLKYLDSTGTPCSGLTAIVLPDSPVICKIGIPHSSRFVVLLETGGASLLVELPDSLFAGGTLLDFISVLGAKIGFVSGIGVVDTACTVILLVDAGAAAAVEEVSS